MEWIHGEKVIKFDEEYGIFVREMDEATALGIPKVENYRSLAEAKESIDKENESARKSKSLELKIKLLDDRGRIMTIRRVHENTGVWLTGKGETKKPITGYLPHNQAEVLLTQRNVLREQVENLDSQLKPYRIELPHSFGKQTPTRIEGLVERLRSAVEKAEVVVRTADIVNAEKEDAQPAQ
jgi:hypothetical protein